MERPSKRARMLDDEDVSDASSDGGVPLKINEEYAARFKHNAERSERMRLEEKYKDNPEESDSDSESEDEGHLATKALDDEIAETLNALRSKDPRIYNKEHNFYAPETDVETEERKEKSKPLHLRDYHRQNLLGEVKREDEPVKTYAEEQATLKKELLGQMQNGDQNADSDASEAEDFMVRKPGQKAEKQKPAEADVDVALADKDPEGYLNTFMASRAWVPTESSAYQPFESDSEEGDNADQFEAAYNLRFENPAHANEKLLSHSREAAAKYSVRRDEPKGRKKVRQEESERKTAKKAQRDEERAKLKKLKVDEAHEKWLRLKEAAGLKKQNLPDEKLLDFLERGFEEGNWDQEMQKLLGEAYYEEREYEDVGAGMGDDEPEAQTAGKKKKKKSKPKWDDDIDIGDIVPDFDEEEERQRQNIRLSDDDDDEDKVASDEDGSNVIEKQEQPELLSKAAKKRQNRIARQKISDFVDNQLTTSNLPMKKHTGFRYRDSSPTSFGLSSREILMADDTQLNQYAGLKKLASYRDQEKKTRDRNKLSKKGRLQKWRRETFGKDADGADLATSREASAKDTEFEKWFNRGRGVLEKGPSADKGKKRKSKHLDDGNHGESEVANGQAKKRKKHKSKKTKTAAVEP